MEFFERHKIDEYFPGAMMIPPMLVWKLPKNKLDKRKEICSNGQYFGQPKLDGSCYVYEKTMSGKSYLFSRRASTTNGLLVEKGDRIPHIMEYLDTIFPPGSIVIAELFYPNERSRNVTAIMGCKAEKAIERQKDKPLQAYIHDMLMYNGNNLLSFENEQRYAALNMRAQEVGQTPQFISFAKAVYKNLDQYIDACIAEGFEGVILKKRNGIYSPTKRPAWNFVKFKIEDEYDVICTGFDSPTKEYKGTTSLKKWKYWEGDSPVTKPYAKGWAGALKLAVYKGDELYPLGTVASGLTDFLLESIKQNPDEYLMKPLKVRAMEPTEGNLREKKFVEFRDDININDCTYEKIFK